MIKKCEICGKEFQTIPNGGSRKYCFDCVPHGLDFGQRTLCKRQAAKHEAVRRLGGCCAKCGETREHILNFHHINPAEKKNAPAQLLADSKIQDFFEETSKCILLCSNCHGDFHFLESNSGITINDYLGYEINRTKDYDMVLEQQKEQHKEELTKLQQIQAQQEAIAKNQRHIYQEGVIAYKDTWVQEFQTVKECVDFFANNILTDIRYDNISDGVRRVLNGKRKTYHGYCFTKSQ